MVSVLCIQGHRTSAGSKPAGAPTESSFWQSLLIRSVACVRPKYAPLDLAEVYIEAASAFNVHFLFLF